MIFKKLIRLKWRTKPSISEFKERLSLYWGPRRPTQNQRQGWSGAVHLAQGPKFFAYKKGCCSLCFWVPKSRVKRCTANLNPASCERLISTLLFSSVSSLNWPHSSFMVPTTRCFWFFSPHLPDQLLPGNPPSLAGNQASSLPRLSGNTSYQIAPPHRSLPKRYLFFVFFYFF